MQPIRLAASAAMTLILLALVALLSGPSFAMPSSSAAAGLGRGALPQFCVVAAAVLAVLVFVRDLLAYRRGGAITGPFEISAGTEPRRVFTVGLAALVLLSAFVVGWQLVGFLPAAISFLVVVSLLLLPRDRWNVRSVGVAGLTGVLFGLGVWALFVYVLQVPLR